MCPKVSGSCKSDFIRPVKKSLIMLKKNWSARVENTTFHTDCLAGTKVVSDNSMGDVRKCIIAEFARW